MIGELFTCANCGRSYEKARPDDEAKREAQELWGPEIAAGEEMVVICDDCFKDAMKTIQKEH